MPKLLELSQWLLYSSFIPLFPIPLVWLSAWLLGIDRSWATILRNGQLCFYCTTLSATTIRDIITRSPADTSLNSIFIGFLVVIIIFSTFLYGTAVTIVELPSEQPPQNDRIVWLSIFTAVATTITVIVTRIILELL
jgi:hypothetical protein